jgi:hypothetical protein
MGLSMGREWTLLLVKPITQNSSESDREVTSEESNTPHKPEANEVPVIKDFAEGDARSSELPSWCELPGGG